MSTQFKLRLPRGFSLIEVLIAIVILSVGLLALAALQINVVRSTADAKSRGSALSLAQEKLEQAREFSSRGSDQVNCPATSASTWPARYSCVVQPSAAESMTVGGTTFTRTWTVTRYVFNETANSFQQVATTTTDSALAAGFRAGTEFKKIDVTVSWVDAEGNTKEVTITDSVSASSPSESSRARAFQRAGVRTPEVLIFDPSGTPGVIPIAIGNGTDTAATNPRPEVAGRRNDPHVIETRFDVLTYSGVNNTNNAQVQSRVETVVVGCTCSDGAGAGLMYRPTYWNGNRYSAPNKITTTAPATHASSTVDPESNYCTECCRDHHDSGFSGPKFSPRRSSHTHNIIGGVYSEACRLIRVDGIFRVAADSYNDYFNLLETANNADDPIPSSNASTNYQNMILGYLGARIVTPSSGYNSPLASGSVTSLEAANSINNPSQIAIQRDAGTKWLHGRGLYFDFLESDAIGVLNEAKANCDTVASSLEACVLSHVPFTSINLTELANWDPRGNAEIIVENNGFDTSTGGAVPVRGKVKSVNATPGSDRVATGSIFNSVSGLALLTAAKVASADEAVTSDAQTFHINGGGTPPAGSTSFTVALAGLPQTNSSSTAAPPTLSTADGTCNPDQANITPYTCTSSGLGAARSIEFGRYNTVDDSQSSSATLSCTGSGIFSSFPTKTYSASHTVRYCKNYALTSANGPGGAGVIGSPLPNDGTISESTVVAFPLISDTDALTIGFTYQGQTATATTCTYTCTQTNSGNTDCRNAQKTVFQVSSAACP